VRDTVCKASPAPERKRIRNIKDAKVDCRMSHGWVRSESGPVLDYLGGKIGESRKAEVGRYKSRVKQNKQYSTVP
jgi:hypothetical protein